MKKLFTGEKVVFDFFSTCCLLLLRATAETDSVLSKTDSREVVGSGGREI